MNFKMAQFQKQGERELFLQSLLILTEEGLDEIDARPEHLPR
jgi:hypothetical protein